MGYKPGLYSFITMKKSRKKSLPEGVLSKVEVVLQPDEVEKHKKASAPIKKKAPPVKKKAILIADPAPKRLKEELSEAMPEDTMRAPSVVGIDDAPEVFHVKRDFEPVGIGLGENTFRVRDEQDIFRKDPRLRENGRDYQVDLDTYDNRTGKYVVDDPNAPFSKEWVKAHEVRLEILEKDPNYAFLVLVAGYANTDVFKLYTNEDLDYLVRREQSLRLGEKLAVEEANITVERQNKLKANEERELTNIEGKINNLIVEMREGEKKIVKFITLNDVYINLAKLSDLYSALYTISMDINDIIGLVNLNPYYFISRSVEYTDDDRKRVYKHFNNLIEEEYNKLLPRPLLNLILPRPDDLEWERKMRQNEAARDYLRSMTFEYRDAYIRFFPIFLDYIEYLMEKNVISMISPSIQKLYRADPTTGQLTRVDPQRNSEDYESTWKKLMMHGWRDDNKSGIMNLYKLSYTNLTTTHPLNPNENVLEYTGRLLTIHWDYQMKDLIDSKTEKEKSIVEIIQNIKDIQAGKPVMKAPLIPYYEHRRDYAQSPAVSGIIHIEPRVSSAMSGAYMYLVREVTWIRQLHERSEINPEFFQRDELLRDSFAELVAVQISVAMDDFPRRWRSDKEKGKIMKRRRDIGLRFVRQYEARTDLVNGEWRLVGKLRARSAPFSIFGK